MVGCFMKRATEKKLSHSDRLAATAQALVVARKGILAADESFPTIGKRFAPLGIPSTEENRRAYRELLFTTPRLGNYISGAILFDETLRQLALDGTPLVVVLDKAGIIPGIKVDLGTTALPNFPGETSTQGLDGLRDRLEEYAALGARFTKWRAVIKIGPESPSDAAIAANAEALAQYAALSQEVGLVPIVEPEVLMDGDHSLARCEEVLMQVLSTVFSALLQHRVKLEGMLLKTGMVLPGKANRVKTSTEEIAVATLRCLRRTVPGAVAGVVFLSGGQSEEEATTRLAAISAQPGAPWPLSFSYGRALQDSALKTWKGDSRQRKKAQQMLQNAARKNSRARSK